VPDDCLIGAFAALPAWLIPLAVFALPALEASIMLGVVVPGETAVIPGGVLAHGRGLPLAVVMVAAVLGAVVGMPSVTRSVRVSARRRAGGRRGFGPSDCSARVTSCGAAAYRRSSSVDGYPLSPVAVRGPGFRLTGR
jgi:hypothetical protein